MYLFRVFLFLSHFKISLPSALASHYLVPIRSYWVEPRLHSLLLPTLVLILELVVLRRPAVRGARRAHKLTRTTKLSPPNHGNGRPKRPHRR